MYLKSSVAVNTINSLRDFVQQNVNWPIQNNVAGAFEPVIVLTVYDTYTHNC